MGNSSSTQNNPARQGSVSRPNSSLRPRTNAHHSDRTPSTPPHSSLRYKKKSLELPDLASLALTPHHSTVRHHQQGPTTAPIPIPVSPYPNAGTTRPQTELPSTARIGDVLLDNPSGGYIAGDPHANNSPVTRGRQMNGHQPPAVAYPETVNSTIPIALAKVEQLEGLEESQETAATPPEEREQIMKISWRGGGSSVVLARAGDDDWKGRQTMDRESPDSNTFVTYVPLPPGTHHIRFIVDDQWRVAEDLPTAVDDEGSLANYVHVGATHTPPTTSAGRTQSPETIRRLQARGTGQSFWSADSSAGDEPTDRTHARNQSQRRFTPQGLGWTDELPPELVAAAQEEEDFLLASSAAVDAGGGTVVSHNFIPGPHIPPAPGLPAHLDKLILNVRSPGVAPSSGRHARGAVVSPGSSRTRDSGARRRRERSMLGMTGSSSVTNLNGTNGVASPTTPTPAPPANGDVIPITTASGTDLTTSIQRDNINERARLDMDGPGLADDGSVLPVPSHVVLHHLSTSAIRNGVLAVGNTTRYRKKYLTTIYYKPT